METNYFSKVELYFGWGQSASFISDKITRNSLFIISKGVFEFHQNLFKDIPRNQIQIISGECSTREIKKLHSIVSEFTVDYIIGIGGGSVMDTVKVIKVMLEYSVSDPMILHNLIVPKPKSIHMSLIPTTAGTGSECSRAAIVYDEYSEIKFGLRGDIYLADIAIVDPMLTSGCSTKTVMESGFDCFAHGVETFISNKTSQIVRNQSVFIIKTIYDNLKQVLSGNNQRDEQILVSMASMLAGVNLYNASTCLPHRIQYAISRERYLSHGAGLRAIYPGWISLSAKRHHAFQDLEKALGVSSFIDFFNSFVEKIDFEMKLPIVLNHLSKNEIIKKINGNLSDDPGYYEDILSEIVDRTFVDKNFMEISKA